ncbi:hypothetical protein B0T18DRAFT_404544 [Schizothecium vesticola]|uniref:Uncharacterized protein n=1 Tax=Schizothecium vesticola TaxID=314040 RepID=A0AA40KAV6_9PEZI|nr:hypothetical protein B0T18DRAFT_404544 [Schizothecium vesticola]
MRSWDRQCGYLPVTSGTVDDPFPPPLWPRLLVHQPAWMDGPIHPIPVHSQPRKGYFAICNLRPPDRGQRRNHLNGPTSYHIGTSAGCGIRRPCVETVRLLSRHPASAGRLPCASVPLACSSHRHGCCAHRREKGGGEVDGGKGREGRLVGTRSVLCKYPRQRRRCGLCLSKVVGSQLGCKYLFSEACCVQCPVPASIVIPTASAPSPVPLPCPLPVAR